MTYHKGFQYFYSFSAYGSNLVPRVFSTFQVANLKIVKENVNLNLKALGSRLLNSTTPKALSNGLRWSTFLLSSIQHKQSKRGVQGYNKKVRESK